LQVTDAAGHATAAPDFTAAVEQASGATNAIMMCSITASLLNSCCQAWQGCCLPSAELVLSAQPKATTWPANAVTLHLTQCTSGCLQSAFLA